MKEERLRNLSKSRLQVDEEAREDSRIMEKGKNETGLLIDAIIFSTSWGELRSPNFLFWFFSP